MSLENIRIVLVRPKNSGNVGAAARAMRNVGMRRLALVSPLAWSRKRADVMAVHARDVLETMQIHPSLRAAVADCGLVVGTTCRSGLYRDGARPVRSVASPLVSAAASNRVALVFGPEDTGLTNVDLRYCHQLMTIPSDPSFASLNVAQAVLVCCYELFLAAQEPAVAGTVPPLAVAERQELMFELLKNALLKIGFLHADNPDHLMLALRRVFGRAGLEDRDVRILLGIARQIEWYSADGSRRRTPQQDGPERLLQHPVSAA